MVNLSVLTRLCLYVLEQFAEQQDPTLWILEVGFMLLIRWLILLIREVKDRTHLSDPELWCLGIIALAGLALFFR